MAQVPDSLSGVKHIVLILSGKGGVGKSSVTTQLALSLTLSGKKVGVLDIDLTGPSVPRMFGIEAKQIHQASGGWIPVYLTPSSIHENSASDHKKNGNAKMGSLCCMSIGFLLQQRGDSVVWRGPKKTAMIKQFLTDVIWGELDYLLIDTPPGTSDEHISVVEKLRDYAPDGAILVTTPQQVSTADVRKELSFCRKTNLKVLGLIENMSGYVCPCCGEVTNIFSSGGGEQMAQEQALPFLGKIPIEPSFVQMIEEQSSNAHDDSGSLLSRYPDCVLSSLFRRISDDLVERLEKPHTWVC